ncbi:periphilin-1-like isoform X2 [Peromyscus leucopus]|uniref:periphilin-1-like isoform X2 n=1 Tax=Peromyscus leucopus TaxID=10041 RepID=UPI0010A1F439|nr:periphilin-1-like isoform X2 [Peromyscus leucopus]
MLHIPVILGHRPRSLYRRDEIWSNRPYDKVLPQNARSDESGLRRMGDGLSASQQRECRDIKDDFKRKCSSSSHYSRQWSPYKGTSCFFRKSNIGQKDSPHSRSGSSGGHSPKGSEQYSSHWSQLRTEEKPEGGQKRPGQSLKTSRDTHPLSSSAVPSSAILDKLNNFDENGLPEAASRQAVENPKMADEGDLPKISEFEVGFTELLLMDQSQGPESNRTEGIELVSDQLTDRLKAIASKTKEIEQAYHQDCETFGMVVKMLVEKDPSLKKSIQFAFRQNLHEISERCVEELRQFIAEYDAS